jgi:hypothetical protein
MTHEEIDVIKPKSDAMTATPNEHKQLMAWCFARLALDEGLDETMRKETWAECGLRLFGDMFTHGLAIHVVEQFVRDLMRHGEDVTIHELAQLVTLSGASIWDTEPRTRALDWALSLYPKEFERCEPRLCSVKMTVVRTVWRRIQPKEPPT